MNLHSGFFCKKLFPKKLKGSNLGKIKKLMRKSFLRIFVCAATDQTSMVFKNQTSMLFEIFHLQKFEPYVFCNFIFSSAFVIPLRLFIRLKDIRKPRPNLKTKLEAEERKTQLGAGSG